MSEQAVRPQVVPTGDDLVPTPDRRYGFFTDTTVCIGRKACEVACKEWNGVPGHLGEFTGHSLDNTGELGANAWRHVAFVEQPVAPTVGLEWFEQPPASAVQGAIDPSGQVGAAAPESGVDVGGIRLLMSSDVCKHCTSAACVEVCPTGALFDTEFDSVVVQDDICNGCGYCVTACRFGVIERRESDGGAQVHPVLRPAGLRGAAGVRAGVPDRLDPVRAARRVARARGEPPRAGQPARAEGSALRRRRGRRRGTGALFLLLDDPEHFRLPPDRVTPTRNLGQLWRWAGVVAGVLVGSIVWTLAAVTCFVRWLRAIEHRQQARDRRAARIAADRAPAEPRP